MLGRMLLRSIFKREFLWDLTLATFALSMTILSFKILFLPFDSASKTASVVPETAARSSYEEGFRKGYFAFLAQEGLYFPPPEASKSYTSSVVDEDVSKGYVEGYHRAAEMEHCPWDLSHYRN